MQNSNLSRPLHKEEKPVSLFELFYDLVFVYAIVNLTKVLEHTDNGAISFFQGLLYIVIAVQVLETWLYQTNYNNRFDSGKWYEVILMSVNMMSVLMLSNIMGVINETTMRISFAIPAVAFLTVGIPYRIIAGKNRSGAKEAQSFSRMIFLFAGIYLAALLVSFFDVPDTMLYVISTALVLAAAFMPSFMRRDFDTSIVDFHHLTERFELLTIVTFGEMVTSAAQYFTVESFDYISIGAFIVVLLLFGSYVIHNHHLINRETDTRGLVLMYSHFGIVLGINLMTVGQTLIHEDAGNITLVGTLMISGILLFYLCMYANGVYYGKRIWSRKEIIGNAFFMAAAVAVMAACRDGRIYLIMMLVLSAVEFSMLLFKKTQMDKQKIIVCLHQEL